MFKTNEIVTDGITEGIEGRQQRGLAIAAKCKVKRIEHDEWIVPSVTSIRGQKYFVKVGKEFTCTCPDHETRGCKCKHIYAVEYVLEREENSDGTTTVTETLTASKRATYPQNWPAYNKAQQNEKNEFQRLLADLCRDLESPAQATGRPKLPIADAVFSAVFKVYSTFSGRRFTCDLCDAQEKGFISRVPHYNSLFRYFEDDAMTPILLALIERSSLPLKSVESDFAVDSTGFMSTRLLRWYDQKYGKPKELRTWVKAHIVCGVKTNVITSVEIHGRDTNDCPILPSLLESTAKNFTMVEVSADKGYSSRENHEAIVSHGAMPYIPFKSHTTGGVGGIFQKAFHYFNLKRDEFLAHYHKRSNIESTMNMVKAKFGDAVRSKTDVAMKNEVLAKILCHNIACLISAIYELGIQPQFALASAPKVEILPQNPDDNEWF